MNLKLFAVALAVAGVATHLYRRQRSRQAAFESSGYPKLDTGALGPADSAAFPDDAPLNAAEHLQHEGIARAPANGNLFTSSSQKGESATAPGLPDLMRGA